MAEESSSVIPAATKSDASEAWKKMLSGDALEIASKIIQEKAKNSQTPVVKEIVKMYEEQTIANTTESCSSTIGTRIVERPQESSSVVLTVTPEDKPPRTRLADPQIDSDVGTDAECPPPTTLKLEVLVPDQTRVCKTGPTSHRPSLGNLVQNYILPVMQEDAPSNSSIEMPGLVSSSSNEPPRLGWIGVSGGRYEDSSSDSSESSSDADSIRPTGYAANAANFEEDMELIPVPEVPVL